MRENLIQAIVIQLKLYFAGLFKKRLFRFTLYFFSDVHFASQASIVKIVIQVIVIQVG
jgi:hypothetical protein